jgi:hypothetical protein
MPFVTAPDGTELYYEVEGEGFPLGFTHGNMGFGQQFFVNSTSKRRSSLMPVSTPRSRSRSSRLSGHAKRSESSPLSRTFTRGMRKNKVRKEFWLDPKLLQMAEEELGVATEREAVEMGLDLVVCCRDSPRPIRWSSVRLPTASFRATLPARTLVPTR